MGKEGLGERMGGQVYDRRLNGNEGEKKESRSAKYTETDGRNRTEKNRQGQTKGGPERKRKSPQANPMNRNRKEGHNHFRRVEK